MLPACGGSTELALPPVRRQGSGKVFWPGCRAGTALVDHVIVKVPWTIGYAPGISDAAWRNAALEGISILRTPGELLNYIKEFG